MHNEIEHLEQPRLPAAPHRRRDGQVPRRFGGIEQIRMRHPERDRVRLLRRQHDILANERIDRANAVASAIVGAALLVGAGRPVVDGV